MSDRNAAARAVSVRDWVETTLNGDTLHALTRNQLPFAERHSVYDSSRELHAGLDFRELDTVPAEFLDTFK
jgi:hypothetical protein